MGFIADIAYAFESVQGARRFGKYSGEVWTRGGGNGYLDVELRWLKFYQVFPHVQCQQLCHN